MACFLYAGMAVTMSGILVVSFEQSPESTDEGSTAKDVNAHGGDDNGLSANPFNMGWLQWGYVLASLNVLLDVYGATLIKQYGRYLTERGGRSVRMGSRKGGGDPEKQGEIEAKACM